MRVAIDAMGGDNAPGMNVRGAIEYLHSFEYKRTLKNVPDFGIERSEIILVGNEDVLKTELENLEDHYPVKIVHAGDVIGMHESPAQALRRKKDASVQVMNRLMKKNQVDAVISAGNTGAAMAASILNNGRLKGVSRPAIATIFPTECGATAILDVGANVNCRPDNLLHFGIMGSTYMKHLFGIERPRIGLLSVGEENTKGNELTLKAHTLLSNSSVNFIGNVEGRDIFKGTADVVVCDGFTGNIILKFAESIFGFLIYSFRDKAMKTFTRKIGARLVKPIFMEMRHEMSYDEYGGAPLLGINGVSIICHGNSSPTAIANAIRVAVRMVNQKINDRIKEGLGVQ